MNKVIKEKLRQIRSGRDLSFSDYTSIDDLNETDLKLLFELAAEFKKNSGIQFKFLKGINIFNLFLENSTRTRCSFETASKRLGANVVNISKTGSSVNKGETPIDTINNLIAIGADMLIIRTSEDGFPRSIANQVSVPIINAGDGKNEHPTQALLDFFTINEHFQGNLENKTITYIGDTKYSRVFGSSLKMAKKLKMNIKVFSPKTLLRDNLENVEICESLEQAVEHTDVINALRIQKERGAILNNNRTCLLPEDLSKANQNAIFMHPGPVIWNEDISDALQNHPQNYILKAVANGMHIRTALIWLLLDNRQTKKHVQYTN